jgi:hypothetical protein
MVVVMNPWSVVDVMDMVDAVGVCVDVGAACAGAGR